MILLRNDIYVTVGSTRALMVLVCTAMFSLASGCGSQTQPTLPVPLSDGSNLDALNGQRDSEAVKTIEVFCGDCHPLPIPSTFPKQRWAEEVLQGFDFYIKSGRNDLVEPNREEAIRYYTSRAPNQLTIPHSDDFPKGDSKARFVRAYEGQTTMESPISYAHIISTGVKGEYLAADMRDGGIYRWRVEDRDDWSKEVVAVAKHACRLTQCDWNKDGIPDYLVGEIGSYTVGDHDKGRVGLLIGLQDGSFEHVVLADGLARVVEAQPIDYDLDGDTDVLVAEFGYLETGSLKLLRNAGSGQSHPEMTVEVLDPRHGAVGLRVSDLNKDGNEDFVVGFGQEYETVEAFYGDGMGNYRRELIYALPDPSYNLSSINLSDLDGDGLVDVVVTNGDTLDTFMAKPYHGVRWLKNGGGKKWIDRELGFLVGALHSAIADFDGDGDLDIAAVGMFPNAMDDGLGFYDSACWWEQQTGGVFVRHSVEKDSCNYTCCLASDVNQDGRIDLVLGKWHHTEGDDSLVVYLNAPR